MSSNCYRDVGFPFAAISYYYYYVSICYASIAAGAVLVDAPYDHRNRYVMLPCSTDLGGLLVTMKRVIS